jgi:hypothetical protein
MSSYWVFFPFLNVPITLNATVPLVGTALGPELDTVVLVAAECGVIVGVGVRCVGVRVGDAGGVGVNVGEVGGPFPIVMESSE